MTSRPNLLYLLRHAKSDWDDASLADLERPLAPRGHRAAAALRRHFADTGLDVDVVLCSPARRAQETWDGVHAGLRRLPELRVEPALYEATARDLLDLVRTTDARVGSLLMIGHNPGFEDLTNRLVDGGDPDALAALGTGYPTGGFATLELATTWPDVEWRSARLAAFVHPRSLAR
jgi:phosphohistidine phosphatase